MEGGPMSFQDEIRSDSEKGFTLSFWDIAEGLLEGGFDDLEGLIVMAAVCLCLYVLWLIVSGILSTASDILSRGGLN
jgi:hypothetical protein